MNNFNASSYLDSDLAQARFARRITAHLNDATLQLPSGVDERLRVAREQALTRARERRLAVSATAPAVAGRSGGAAVLGGGPRWWLRLAAAVPLAVLVGGLVLIQSGHDRAQIEAAADIDAALLTDNLPPDAYSDPGFVEFLKSPRE